MCCHILSWKVGFQLSLYNQSISTEALQSHALRRKRTALHSKMKALITFCLCQAFFTSASLVNASPSADASTMCQDWTILLVSWNKAQQPKYLSTKTNVNESLTLLSTKCQADQHELFTFLQSATKDISSFLRLTNGRGLESTAGETYR
eukprot:m.250299 g.250299  ORF g.250299 m.250299 type:complete len:149 (+) comp40316_c0_seq5:455-901(+)